MELMFILIIEYWLVFEDLLLHVIFHPFRL
nr:MAG TPA: hypothetical protein [Caudoviricetes sp.]